MPAGGSAAVDATLVTAHAVFLLFLASHLALRCADSTAHPVLESELAALDSASLLPAATLCASEPSAPLPRAPRCLFSSSDDSDPQPVEIRPMCAGRPRSNGMCLAAAEPRAHKI